MASPGLGRMPSLGRLKPPILHLVYGVQNAEPRDLPFGSPCGHHHLAIEALGRGECWLVGQFGFPE